MIALEVYVNGKKICTAGLRDLGDLCVHLDWRRGPHVAPSTGFEHDFELSELAISGVNVRYKKKVAPHLKAGFRYAESLEWAKRKIQPGDEVMIKVVEVTSADKPKMRKPPLARCTQSLRDFKSYVRKAAKAWGWKIQT